MGSGASVSTRDESTVGVSANQTAIKGKQTGLAISVNKNTGVVTKHPNQRNNKEASLRKKELNFEKNTLSTIKRQPQHGNHDSSTGTKTNKAFTMRPKKHNSNPNSPRPVVPSKYHHLHVQSSSTDNQENPSSHANIRRSNTDFLGNSDRKFLIQGLHSEAQSAIREGKVFVVSKGRAGRVIHRCLRRRNYIRKLDPFVSLTNKRSLDIVPDMGNGLTPRAFKSRLTSNDRSGLRHVIGGDDLDQDKSSDNEKESVHSDDDSESAIEYMSKFARNVTPSFVWTVGVNQHFIKKASASTQVNHFPTSAVFTTKNGLTTVLKNLAWHAGESEDSIYPRCYRIANAEEKRAFIDDFRLTACVSVATMATEEFQKNRMRQEQMTEQQNKENIKKDKQEIPGVTLGDEASDVTQRSPPLKSWKRASDESTVLQLLNDMGNERPRSSLKARPKSDIKKTETAAEFLGSSVVEFAINACQRYLAEFDMDCIDEPKKDNIPEERYLGASESDWQQFTSDYYKLVNNETVLDSNARGYSNTCEQVIEKMREVRPMTSVDGVRNIWICKPGALSRGRGITCQSYLPNILSMVSSNSNPGEKEGKIVVQKYIENCFLIHNTKFDIRQWFLVTDWNPLTVWFYKDCYIRLCSQLYSLENLDVSVHLSNNSIQAYLENDKNRSKQLPQENMLTSSEFAKYLKQQGHGNVFYEKMSPKMKSIITSTMQCCQEHMENVKGCFELYGADFVIGSDLSVWLIEINSSPALEPSTQVTRKLCAQVVEDTVKVVIDNREDKSADTGRFELALKQDTIPKPIYCGQNFLIEGVSVSRPPLSNMPPIVRSGTEASSLKHRIEASKNRPALKPKSLAGKQPISSLSIAEVQAVKKSTPSFLTTGDPFLTPAPIRNNAHYTSIISGKPIEKDRRIEDTASVYLTPSKMKEQDRARLHKYMKSPNERQAVLRHLAAYDFTDNHRPSSKNSDPPIEHRSSIRSHGLNLASMNTTPRSVNTLTFDGRRSGSIPRRNFSTGLPGSPLEMEDSVIPYAKIITQRQKEAVHKIYGSSKNAINSMAQNSDHKSFSNNSKNVSLFSPTPNNLILI